MKDTLGDFNGLIANRMAGEQAFAAWHTAQQEFLAFMTRRAQAAANWPAEIWNCRSPQDLFQHQQRFLHDLLADWQSSSERVLGLFSPTQSDRPAN